LEKTVFKGFEKGKSTKLKDAINDLYLQKIKPKGFKEILLLDVFIELIEDLMKIFPFYNDYKNKTRELDDYTNTDADKKALEEALEERNKFLKSSGRELLDLITKYKQKKSTGLKV